MTIDWTYVARDGAILAAGACGLIALMLRRNPRLFLRHFPAALRDRLPAKSPAERRESLAGGLALIGWILGVLLVSTAAAETRLEAGMAGLVLHAFLVGMAFNLADWLILDSSGWGSGGPDGFCRRTSTPPRSASTTASTSATS